MISINCSIPTADVVSNHISHGRKLIVGKKTSKGNSNKRRKETPPTLDLRCDMNKDFNKPKKESEMKKGKQAATNRSASMTEDVFKAADIEDKVLYAMDLNPQQIECVSFFIIRFNSS